MLTLNTRPPVVTFDPKPLRKQAQRAQQAHAEAKNRWKTEAGTSVHQSPFQGFTRVQVVYGLLFVFFVDKVL